MKTILKSALVAIAALAVGLTGCQKNTGTDSPSTEGGKSIAVAFSHSDLPDTRALGDSEGTQDVALTSARVYFVTTSGVIMDYLTIDCSVKTTAYNSDTKVVGLNFVDIESTPGGQLVEGLPASVTKVVIVANASTYYTSGNVSQHGAAIANLTDFDAIPLSGDAPIVATGETNPTTGAVIYAAGVIVAPIGARIEIASIVADGAGSTIESFTLAGIYANNFYPTMDMDGTNPGTIVNGGSDKDNYVGGSAPYTLTNLYDNPAGADAKSYTAGAGKVWGYNLLAPTTDDAEMAHIVVHLTDVVIATDDDTTYAGDRYLTIRHFWLDGEKLEKLEKGHIYKIEKLSFAESDLTDKPEIYMLDVYVKATVKGWSAETVTTDFE